MKNYTVATATSFDKNIMVLTNKCVKQISETTNQSPHKTIYEHLIFFLHVVYMYF